MLFTCSNFGIIFCWNTKTFKKTFEFYSHYKTTSILALDYDPVNDLILFSND